jgi:hypothetical protein
MRLEEPWMEIQKINLFLKITVMSVHSKPLKTLIPETNIMEKEIQTKESV